MILINFDITHANKAIICFESGTPLNIINTVQINILIGTIYFCIIDTLTLFFFCLKNMDILSIYFNSHYQSV